MLVRTCAMCQVNGEGSFSAPWGSETPEPIHLKFGTFDCDRCPTPDAKYSGEWPPHSGNGVGR